LSVFINLRCAESMCLYYGLRVCLQNKLNSIFDETKSVVEKERLNF